VGAVRSSLSLGDRTAGHIPENFPRHPAALGAMVPSCTATGSNLSPHSAAPPQPGKLALLGHCPPCCRLPARRQAAYPADAAGPLPALLQPAHPAKLCPARCCLLTWRQHIIKQENGPHLSLKGQQQQALDCGCGRRTKADAVEALLGARVAHLGDGSLQQAARRGSLGSLRNVRVAAGGDVQGLLPLRLLPARWQKNSGAMQFSVLLVSAVIFVARWSVALPKRAGSCTALDPQSSAVQVQVEQCSAGAGAVQVQVERSAAQRSAGAAQCRWSAVHVQVEHSAGAVQVERSAGAGGAQCSAGAASGHQ
jgi:hypothetical protein